MHVTAVKGSKSKRFRGFVAGRIKFQWARFLVGVMLLGFGAAYVSGVRRRLNKVYEEAATGPFEPLRESTDSVAESKHSGSTVDPKAESKELKGLRAMIRTEQAHVKALTFDVREKREAVHEAQANLKRAEDNLEKKATRTGFTGSKFMTDKILSTSKYVVSTMQSTLKEKISDFEAAKKRLAKESVKLSNREKERSSVAKGLSGHKTKDNKATQAESRGDEDRESQTEVKLKDDDDAQEDEGTVERRQLSRSFL